MGGPEAGPHRERKDDNLSGFTGLAKVETKSTGTVRVRKCGGLTRDKMSHKLA